MSATYKAVSFDVWGTLLGRNPDFSRLRDRYFADVLGYSGDVARLTSAKRAVDKKFDRMAETTGVDYGFAVRMQALANEVLGGDAPILSPARLLEIEDGQGRLRLKHLPSLVEPGSLDVFRALRERGVKVALINNTGFIGGSVMRKVLSEMGIAELIDAAVFSNIQGCAKPSRGIFQAMLEAVGCDARDALHVGDSVLADVEGAWNAGLHGLHFDPKRRHCGRHRSITSLSQTVAIVDSGHRVMRRLVEPLRTLRKDKTGLVDDNGVLFDGTDYSRFKYGDSDAGIRLGNDLAAHSLRARPGFFQGEERIVLVAPVCRTVPKGATTILRGYRDGLNRHLLSLGNRPVSEATVYKEEMFGGDYALLSAEERVTKQRSDMHAPVSMLRGSKVVTIDDARITGAHEDNLALYLERLGVKETLFLYVAEVDGEYAKAYPQVEAELNHSWMNSPERFLELARLPNFTLNARVCKYVLAQKGDGLRWLLTRMPAQALYDLYSGILADGYRFIPEYAVAFDEVESESLRRGLISPLSDPSKPL